MSLKGLKKRFKKLMANPAFQFAVAAAAIYFTAGAASGAASGPAAGSTAGGTAGATGGATGATTGAAAGGTAGAATGAATGETIAAGATNAATQTAATGAVEGIGQSAATETLAAESAGTLATEAGKEGLTQAALEQGAGNVAKGGVAGQTPLPGIETTAGKPGFFSRAGSFVEKNPLASAMMFQGVQSAFAEDPEEEAAKRERRRWANMKVPGSVGYSVNNRPLYTVDGQPVYNSRGIINRGMK